MDLPQRSDEHAVNHVWPDCTTTCRPAMDRIPQFRSILFHSTV